MGKFLVLVLRTRHGSVVLLTVSGSAVSALSDELASLVARARASAPPQPALPLFTEGEVVEPREVFAGADLSDAASNTASTPAWCQPPPRRSLREEREARDLLALVKVTQEARRLAQRLRDARRAREARQLQELVLLAAALRRAGFPR